jgi:hypothetical protein
MLAELHESAFRTSSLDGETTSTLLQIDWHLAQHETRRDEVARFRNSFTEKWVICMTFPSVFKACFFPAFPCWSLWSHVASERTSVASRNRIHYPDALRCACLCVLIDIARILRACNHY